MGHAGLPVSTFLDLRFDALRALGLAFDLELTPQFDSNMHASTS